MAIALDKDVVFNPISFDNFVAPFQMYKQAYDKTQEAYDKLTEKASLEFAESDKSSKAYQKWQSYMDGLKATVDDFATGMTLQNSTALRSYKTGYSTDIIPIEKALARRAAMAEEQRKLLSSGQQMLFERNAGDLSIDKLMADPNLNTGRAADLDKVSKEAMQAFGLLTNISRGTNTRAVDSYTNMLIQNFGFTPQEVQQFMANPESDQTMLKTVYDKINAKYGFNNWENWNDIKDQVQGAITENAMAAITQPKTQIYENRAARDSPPQPTIKDLIAQLSDDDVAWLSKLYGLSSDKSIIYQREALTAMHKPDNDSYNQWKAKNKGKLFRINGRDNILRDVTNSEEDTHAYRKFCRTDALHASRHRNYEHNGNHAPFIPTFIYDNGWLQSIDLRIKAAGGSNKLVPFITVQNTAKAYEIFANSSYGPQGKTLRSMLESGNSQMNTNPVKLLENSIYNDEKKVKRYIGAAGSNWFQDDFNARNDLNNYANLTGILLRNPYLREALDRNEAEILVQAAAVNSKTAYVMIKIKDDDK